jgi:hypothetical protein
MAYARHVNYGDDIEVADTNADGIANIDPNETEDFEVFDKLEWQDPHASEAALKANPGDTLFYAIWNEALEGEETCEDAERGGRSSGVAEVSCNSDAVVRRTMELGDLYVTTPTGSDSDGGGTEPPGQGGGGGR